MSEDKKSLIDLVPDSVDNAVKNITDKPTQNMGTTLADIWYLVFGGISQAAEKRKLKYSYALQEFENELKEKISKIPEDIKVEPDIQIIAKALEEAKYCVEKEELRKMFSNLISKSLDRTTEQNVHPIFINIISQLNSSDAELMEKIYKIDEGSSIKLDIENEYKFLISLSVLEHNGLIKSDIHEKIMTASWGNHEALTSFIKSSEGYSTKIELTELGRLFCKICIHDTLQWYFAHTLESPISLPYLVYI